MKLLPTFNHREAHIRHFVYFKNSNLQSLNKSSNFKIPSTLGVTGTTLGKRHFLTFTVNKIFSHKCTGVHAVHAYIPDWNTYLASDCIRAAGQVGGQDSPGSRFSLNVNSNPKPLIPSAPTYLQ